MIRIVPPRRVFALAAILLVLAATVVWAVVATIPTTLVGPGFLLPQGGLRVAEAATTGTVTSLTVGDGDHVVADEQIGEITDAAGVVVPIRSPETGEITEVDTVLHGHVGTGDRLALVQRSAGRSSSTRTCRRATRGRSPSGPRSRSNSARGSAPSTASHAVTSST